VLTGWRGHWLLGAAISRRDLWEFTAHGWRRHPAFALTLLPAQAAPKSPPEIYPEIYPLTIYKSGITLLVSNV
jgi:hypothetical protein